jgi:hypothetical protein
MSDRIIVKINPNCRVRVRLLDSGKEILRRHAAKLASYMRGTISADWRESFRYSLSTDDTGKDVFTGQLHEIMYYFGPGMNNGVQPPFEMCIEVFEPAANESYLCEIQPQEENAE